MKGSQSAKSHGQQRWLRSLRFILVVALALTSFPLISTAQGDDQIRVALFVDTGSRYQNTVPSVTLKSDQPFLYSGLSGTFANIENAAYARFSADQYFIRFSETSNVSEARQIAQKLSQQGFSSTIVQLIKNGGPMYQVLSQSEASLDTIRQKQREIQEMTGLQGTVSGPYRVQAGRFSSLGDAQQRLAEIQQSSAYSAYLAQVRNGEELYYDVWIGDSLDVGGQQQLLQQLQQSFPQYSFSAVSSTEYLLHKNMVLLNQQQSSSYPYILVSAKTRLTVTPQSGSLPLITVEERGNRSYRGQIELSVYQDKFTVVNKLPFEEYIYGVVGTEMTSGWPLEALKAQAVIARNYAYIHMNQNTYGIAHLSDSTFEQAYYGYHREAADIRQAVDATRGEVLTYRGQVFTTFYHSNAGGRTAQGSEVWLNDLEHHSSVESPDQYPQTIQVPWYRVQDQYGTIGYVSSEYVEKTPETNALGLSYGRVSADSLNFRTGPSTSHERIGSFSQGTRVLILEEVWENNAYSWIAGPYDGVQLMNWINGRPAQESSPIRSFVYSLKVTQRGPSGRVTAMEANGQPIRTSSPDAYRSVFMDGNGSIRSTLFEVEEMGDVTVLAAGNRQETYPRSTGGSQQFYAIQSNDRQAREVNPQGDQFVALATNQPTACYLQRSDVPFAW